MLLGQLSISDLNTHAPRVSLQSSSIEKSPLSAHLSFGWQQRGASVPEVGSGVLIIHLDCTKCGYSMSRIFLVSREATRLQFHSGGRAALLQPACLF